LRIAGVFLAMVVGCGEVAIEPHDAGEELPDLGFRPRVSPEATEDLAVSADGRLAAYALGGGKLRVEALTSTLALARYRIHGDVPSRALVSYRFRAEDLGGGSPLALRLVTQSGTAPPSIAEFGGFESEDRLLGLIDVPARVGILRRGCVPDPATEGSCEDAERCIFDVEAVDEFACQIPCAGDSDCASPYYCLRGACGLRSCGAASPCSRSGERCAGARDLRVCTSSAAFCARDQDCPQDERCHRPRGSGTGRCRPLVQGCIGGESACTGVYTRATSSFHGPPALSSENVWSYGWRDSLLEPEAFHPFRLFARLPGQERWSSEVSNSPTLVRATSAEAPSGVPEWLTLSTNSYFDETRRASILRWIAPRTGRYYLEIWSLGLAMPASTWVSRGSPAGLREQVFLNRRFDGVTYDSGELVFRAGEDLDMAADNQVGFPLSTIAIDAALTYMGRQ